MSKAGHNTEGGEHERTLDDDVSALIDQLDTDDPAPGAHEEASAPEAHTTPEQARHGLMRAEPPDPARDLGPVEYEEAPEEEPEPSDEEAAEPEAAAAPDEEPAPEQTPAPGAAEAAVSSESIESLDAQLAGLADDLLDQEPSDAPDVPFRPPMPAVAALEPEVYRPRAAPVVEKETEPAQEDKGKAADTAAAAPVEAGGGMKFGEWWALVREPLCEHAHKALSALAAPLSKHPPVVRTTVSIAAIFNVVLAGIVWFYVAFMRPEFAAPPPPVVKSAAKAEKDDHGKGGKGGEKAAKGKAGAKGKDAGGHGGGGH